MQPLSPLLPFHPDETPLSWAARLAAFHTSGPLVPFLNDQRIQIKDLIGGINGSIERLCERAGQDPDPVLHNTFIRLSLRHYRLRDEELSVEMLKGPRTLFCPACLAEDGAGSKKPDVFRRGRLIWMLRPVRTCPIHQRPLIARQSKMWRDAAHELALLVPDSDAELRILAEGLPNRVPSPLQDYVTCRFEGKPGPDWLDRQSLEQATRATEMLGGLIAFGPETQASQMSDDDWDLAARAGFAPVQKGPAGIHAALMPCHHAAVSKGPQAFKRPGPYGMLQTWLSSHKRCKDPGPIMEVLRDQIIDTQDVRVGTKVLNQVVHAPRWCSISSLARSEQVHPLTFRNFLIARRIIPEDANTRSCTQTLVEYPLGRNLAAQMKRVVPINCLPKALHTSRPVVQSLIRAGLLPLMRGDGYQRWLRKFEQLG